MATIPLLAAGNRKGVLVGGWKSKEDLSEPHVTEIRRFAVMSTKNSQRTSSSSRAWRRVRLRWFPAPITD
ncbi:hypothetical protein CUMW_199320 [Citrus unshiu]|nr:hypothetical protein CUMW_199320 [Citrus unshiu]